MADRDLKLDGVELVFDEDGQAQTVEGVELVAQYVRQTLEAHSGEWAWDQSFGIPYRREILRKLRQVDIGAINARVRATLQSVPDVNRILRFDPVYAATLRKYTVSAELDTVYGPVEVTL